MKNKDDLTQRTQRKVKMISRKIEIGFRADMVVEDMVIVELKSVEQLLPVHMKQLITYVKLADKRLGLFINFGSALIKNGILHAVNGLVE